MGPWGSGREGRWVAISGLCRHQQGGAEYSVRPRSGAHAVVSGMSVSVIVALDTTRLVRSMPHNTADAPHVTRLSAMM